MSSCHPFLSVFFFPINACISEQNMSILLIFLYLACEWVSINICYCCTTYIYKYIWNCICLVCFSSIIFELLCVFDVFRYKLFVCVFFSVSHFHFGFAFRLNDAVFHFTYECIEIIIICQNKQTFERWTTTYEYLVFSAFKRFSSNSFYFVKVGSVTLVAYSISISSIVYYVENPVNDLNLFVFRSIERKRMRACITEECLRPYSDAIFWHSMKMKFYWMCNVYLTWIHFAGS